MVWSRPLFVGVLFIAGLLLACGDDDNGEDTGTATLTSSPAPSRTGTGMASPTNGADGDLKTPPPDETPNGGGETPVDTGTPPPTGIGGTPAPRIENVSAFFAQFPSPPQDERVCPYNLGTRLVDCSDRGIFAPDPPPVGQGTLCYVMVSGGNAAALRCEIVEPQSTAYYDARG